MHNQTKKHKQQFNPLPLGQTWAWKLLEDVPYDDPSSKLTFCTKNNKDKDMWLLFSLIPPEAIHSMHTLNMRKSNMAISSWKSLVSYGDWFWFTQDKYWQILFFFLWTAAKKIIMKGKGMIMQMDKFCNQTWDT